MKSVIRQLRLLADSNHLQENRQSPRTVRALFICTFEKTCGAFESRQASTVKAGRWV